MAFDRILTTHVGSLPRPQPVVDQVFAEDRGDEVDYEVYARVISGAVADVLGKRAEADICWAKLRSLAEGAELATKRVA